MPTEVVTDKDGKRESTFGGPTFWVEGPDGLWGEFALPEGKRIENGDSFNLFECTFVRGFYREVSAPRLPKNPTPKEREEYGRKSKEWREILEREDIEVTLALGKPGDPIPRFVTLVPLNENGT